MKKIVALLLLFSSLLVFSATTPATSTLFLGKTFFGQGTSNDYFNNQSYSGNISAYEIDFSYIKKIKLDFDYQNGELAYDGGPPSFELWDIQMGYPFFNTDKGMVCSTLGLLSYSENSELAFVSRHQVSCPMFGLDIILTPIDSIQFEVDLKHSFLGGSSVLYYADETSNGTLSSFPELTAVKIRFIYILFDNLGLVVNYRSLIYNTEDYLNKVVGTDTTALGLIYRF